MNSFKLIFYIIMVIGSFVMVSDYCHSDDVVGGILTFITVLAIFYWIYKILNTLIKITEEREDNYYNRGSYKKTTGNTEYYKRFQPNPDHRSKYLCDDKKKEQEFAEKISANLSIRDDIKVLELETKK